MKKLLKLLSILILLGLSIGSKAQVNFNMGVGLSTSKTATGQIGLNYELSKIAIGGEIRPSLTRSVNSPQLFGFRAGYNVLNSEDEVIPFVGYYWDKFSDSKQQKGEWITGYGIIAVKSISDVGSIYFEPSYIKGINLLIGVIVKF